MERASSVRPRRGAGEVPRAASIRPRREPRALSSLRGPGHRGSESVWVGDAMLLETPSEPDAEPPPSARAPNPKWNGRNRTTSARLHAIPNDPSYARQWNFADDRRAASLGHQPGRASDVIVAVLDTGVTTTSTTLRDAALDRIGHRDAWTSRLPPSPTSRRRAFFLAVTSCSGPGPSSTWLATARTSPGPCSRKPTTPSGFRASRIARG